MIAPRTLRHTFLFPLLLLLGSVGLPAQGMFGVELDSGMLYRVDPASAGLTAVGPTGVTNMAALEFAADGTLYGFNVGIGPTLYRIDPTTATATAIGPLNINLVFEGSLAFAPDGTAYATNKDNATIPTLFRIDLSTGAGTPIGVITGGDHDINGLAWRPDGRLVGLDRVTNSLLAIDPTSASSSVIAPLPPTVGGVGGMTVYGGVAFFGTSGPNGGGSNELWTCDLFTGAATRVGSFAPTIRGFGISGLAGFCSGGFLPYGAGLAGTGAIVPALNAGGCPLPGSQVTIEVTRGLGDAHGCLLIGEQRQDLPILGGTLLVVPLFVIVHRLDGAGAGNGTFSASLRIPADPAFADACLYLQSVYCDPGAVQEVSMTAGVKMTIGNDGSN